MSCHCLLNGRGGTNTTRWSEAGMERVGPSLPLHKYISLFIIYVDALHNITLHTQEELELISYVFELLDVLPNLVLALTTVTTLKAYSNTNATTFTNYFKTI